jgi:hypothetical protein
VQELARALAFAAGAHAAETGFKVIVAGHGTDCPGWKCLTMRAIRNAENRCCPEWLKSAIFGVVDTVVSAMALLDGARKTMCRQ